MTVRCSGDISRSWRRADCRITGSVPWSTVSFGLAAIIVLKSDTLIFITSAGAVASEGRVVGISCLAVGITGLAKIARKIAVVPDVKEADSLQRHDHGKLIASV